MRIALPAITACLALAGPAWAQESAPPPNPTAGPAGKIVPQIATSHTQIAERLAKRGGDGGDGKPSAAEARVEAAAKSTEAAIADDPTVREQVRQDPTLPPSLAGGAPEPRPKPATNPR